MAAFDAAEAVQFPAAELQALLPDVWRATVASSQHHADWNFVGTILFTSGPLIIAAVPNQATTRLRPYLR